MYSSRISEYDGPSVVPVGRAAYALPDTQSPSKKMGIMENRSHRVTDEEAVEEDKTQTKLEEVMVEGVNSAGHQHKSIRPNVPSTSERISYLQEEEARLSHLTLLENERQSKRRKRSVVNLGDSYKVGPAKAKNSGRTCTNCGKTGHDRRNCNKPRLNSSGEVIVSQRKCTRCGSLKHDRRTCLVTAEQIVAQEVRAEMARNSCVVVPPQAPHPYAAAATHNPAQIPAPHALPPHVQPPYPHFPPGSLPPGMTYNPYAFPPGYPLPPYHLATYGPPGLPYGYPPPPFSAMSPQGGGTAPPGYPSMPLSPLATLAGTDNGSGKLARVVGEQPTAEKITTAVKEEEGQDAAQLLLSFGKKS